MRPLALLLSLLLTTSLPGATHPNIVFILVDDVAWSDFGCYGNAIHDTPNIDRLAGEGMRFTQAYAPAPICSASRAAILTGKTPARLHFEFVTKNEPGRQVIKAKLPLRAPPFTLDLPLSEITLGEVLSEAGYATGFYGKWHVSRHHKGYLGWSPTHGPLEQGFAEGSGDFGSHPYGYRADRSLRDRKLPDGIFPGDRLTDRAIGFIERHRDERFFLYLSHYFVHDPVHTRCDWLIEKYRDRLSPDALEVRASYAAMIETLDHLVGRVLDALEAADLADDTLVVLTSDNGGHPAYTSNAPLRGSKWNLYEGGIRVPLIVRWPGRVEPGSSNDTPVHGCDYFPTVCAAAQLEPPAGALDGVNLLPVLEDAGTHFDRRELPVWHFPYYHPEKGFGGAPAEIGISDFVTSQTRPHSALRSGDWKLLAFHEEDRVELYDLNTDPGEQTNLSSARPDVATHLREEMIRHLKAADARFPAPVHGDPGRDGTP